MFVLKRDYGSGFFNIQEIAPSDVADFIECGVAIFGSETHASYAQSLLGAVSAPHWKPNHQRYFLGCLSGSSQCEKSTNTLIGLEK